MSIIIPNINILVHELNVKELSSSPHKYTHTIMHVCVLGTVCNTDSDQRVTAIVFHVKCI